MQQSRQEDATLEARIQSFELALSDADAGDQRRWTFPAESKVIHDLYQSNTVHGRQLLTAAGV
ncbi:MAG UNVERIFIED_CONTAM: hypothetical protein LVR18_25050 [Planctomycetaceae bacterium]|jgi:hypothetical protein